MNVPQASADIGLISQGLQSAFLSRTEVRKYECNVFATFKQYDSGRSGKLFSAREKHRADSAR